MSKPYHIKVMSAKYDETEGMLVLNAWMEDFGEKRIIYMSKKDFTFKGDPNVPDEEMHKTASMLIGKWINLQIEDDPNRKQITPEEEGDLAKQFRDDVSSAMDRISQTMMDPQQDLERNIKRVLDKERMCGNIEEDLLKGKLHVED